MLATAYLRPTTLQRIRSFLSSHGASVPPGSTVGEAREGLVALLAARVDDPGFWDAVRDLVAAIRADQAAGRERGLPTGAAEPLSATEIDALLARLSTLPSSGPGRSERAAAPSGPSAAVTALAALLAAAWMTGCDPPGAPADAPRPPGQVDGAALEPTAGDAAPDASSGDALETLFRDGSPDEIAARLEAMVDAGVPIDDAAADARASGAAAPDAAVKQTNKPPRPPRPIAVPMYKGVTV